jgi:hypothetical protein
VIITILYFLIIVFLIYRNGFFGVIKDKHISSFQFILLFTFKCLAIPVFYWVYQTYYGGLKNFDAGKFFDDSKVINSIAYSHPLEYLKLLFGLQADQEGTFLYENFIKYTANWDEGNSWRLFFNDNRTIIRFHSIIHFISFNTYAVHALVSCFLSFIGTVFIYRSFKQLFVAREFWVLLIFVALPNLWLFSGALLKEPLVIFQLGLIFIFIDRIFQRQNSGFKKLLFLLAICFIGYILKPQVTLPVAMFYFIYKLVISLPFNYKSLIYLALIISTITIVNFAFVPVKKMTMLSFINKKQMEFYDAMKGGIFLKDDKKFVRLPYDQSLIIKDSAASQTTIRIKKGVSYVYWEHHHQKDTLYCSNNSDTSTQYTLAYQLIPARSFYTIEPLTFNSNLFSTIANSVYYGLFYPLKFNSLLNTIVSLENLLNLLCLFIVVIGLIKADQRIHLVFFLSLVLVFVILIGISTPNVGAIVRYRSVITPFLILAALKTIITFYDAGNFFRRANKNI